LTEKMHGAKTHTTTPTETRKVEGKISSDAKNYLLTQEND